MEEGSSPFSILTDTPTGMRPSGSPRHRWEDNLKIYFKEMFINTRNWLDLAQDWDYSRALVNGALNLRVCLPWD